MVSTTIFIDGSQVQSLLKDVILIIIHLCLENSNFPPPKLLFYILQSSENCFYFTCDENNSTYK